MVHHAKRITGLVALGLMLGSGAAWAGPPLLCHPFDIGAERSLAWDGTNGWVGMKSGYDTKQLIADTTTLLTPSTPVIVRMETLRRAALYASRDADVARQLLTTLNERARSSVGAANDNPLALFDAGYFTETLRQISMLDREPRFRETAPALARLVGDVDGYALVKKSALMRPSDGAIELAAALISSGGERANYAAHVAKARQGATRDALLARNLDHVAN